MAIDTQKLRERIDAAIKRIKSGSAPMRIPADQTDPDLVLADAKIALDAQAAEIAEAKGQIEHLDRLNNALRQSLDRLAKTFEAARDGAEGWFRESGNIYHDGRKVAYDQAVAEVRAALQETSHG